MHGKSRTEGEAARAAEPRPAEETQAGEAFDVSVLAPEVRDRLEQLRDLPMFRGIPADELIPLAVASETVRFEPDQHVVRQGEPGDSVYVIMQGRIEVLAKVERDGIATESAVASLMDGDALGELSVLDGRPRSASCVAAIPTTCVRLQREVLRAAMMRHWPLAERLLMTLAERLRHADTVMAEHARDPLTGVYNRRALYELYERESRRAQRLARRAAQLSHEQIVGGKQGEPIEEPPVGHAAHAARRGSREGEPSHRPGDEGAQDWVLPVAVLFVDVNKFKIINDTYGHKTGDDVLCAVARTLAAEGRTTDHVARYGGDEFVMILPDGGESGAKLVCDRVRDTLANNPPGPVPFSISIGTAVVDPLEPPTLDALMKRADEEMYKDKARQR